MTFKERADLIAVRYGLVGDRYVARTIEAALRVARSEALQEAATLAYNQIRCDDRTDRTVVAENVRVDIESLGARDV